MKVDFAICGTQKGGTTALDSYLREHPEVCMASRKEVHYFDTDKNFAVSSQDYSTYHSWFTPLARHRVIGEATPIYMYWNKAPGRMHAYNPAMKIVVMLRCPIQRAFSHWNMERVRGNETLSFWKALMREKSRLQLVSPDQHRVYSYVDRGFYTKQLQRIAQYFERGQLLVLKGEELSQAPKGALHKVSEFLGISPFAEAVPRKVHATPYSVTMTERERTYLRDLFCEEIQTLERYLGWDCSNWLGD